MAAGNNTDIEKRLWNAADQLRPTSQLKSSKHSPPVLAVVYLCYADHRFTLAKEELEA